MNNEDATFEALQLRVVIGVYGDKFYYNHNNELHRIHGPAAEWADGDKFWWVNGHHHRTDGPAVEFSDGGKEWYLNDEYLTEEEFLKHPLCTIK